MSDDDKLDGPYLGDKRIRDIVAKPEPPEGTGLQDPITLSQQEVVALFCYEEGVIPDGPQRKVGFRWKTPVKGSGEVRSGKTETWLRHWRIGEFVDIGRDGVVGIAWRSVKIEG